MHHTDTIASVVTAPGNAGVGIVRISGGEAFAVAGKLYRGRADFTGIRDRSFVYGKIADPYTGNVFDEGLFLKMQAPRSYTGEDTIEIQSHGGSAVLKKIMEILIALGARQADPGEFTRRAFINGKKDLAEAESVLDIINAKSEKALYLAAGQLSGRLSERITGFRNNILELIAYFEARIDFPEEDIEEMSGELILRQLDELLESHRLLLQTFREGKVVKEGIRIALVGKPNVGKSTLLNNLLQEERAIVTDIPGTTRDVIEESVIIKGIPFVAVDTAGIRETTDVVEKIGVEKTRTAVRSADFILHIIDNQTGWTSGDEDILEASRSSGGYFIIINKTDLEDNPDAPPPPSGFSDRILRVSAGYDEDLAGLRKLLAEEVSRDFIPGESLILTNGRHNGLLKRSLDSLEKSRETYLAGLPDDFITIDLRMSWEVLGMITGETAGEDILEMIFSKFCIGK